MGHNHEHNHEISHENEKRTLAVIIFSAITMFFEILFGYLTNSMALLADGFHMTTHVFALMLTYLAYVLMHKFENSPIFPNGCDKIGTLCAYTSSLFLGLTGLWIIYEAVERFINPLNIKFDEAIIVAIIGLVVNLVCVFVMNNKNHHHDYNYKAAYYHILADAMTSVFAILALLVGKFFNISYLDSLAGILGGILILKWAAGLIKNTVIILVDAKKSKKADLS